MNKKNKRNNLIDYSFYFLTGFVILIFFIVILNVLVNCIKMYANNLPIKEPLPSLIRQLESIDIAPIIIMTLIAFILSLIIIRKFRPIVRIFSILNILVASFLVLDLVLLFTGTIPIEEEITLYSRCCAYLDSQPSPWFWVTVILSVIVVSLSFALLTNVILNKFLLKKSPR